MLLDGLTGVSEEVRTESVVSADVKEELFVVPWLSPLSDFAEETATTSGGESLAPAASDSAAALMRAGRKIR